MSSSYNPGDVAINNLSIISPRSSTINFTPNFLNASVVETIFTPGVMATIDVIDYSDYIGEMKLAGDEQVVFSFARPNGRVANYTLHLNTIQNIENQGAVKAKTYQLQCISRETLTGQSVHEQSNNNSQISNIIQTLSKKLNSNLPVDVEQTMGVRNVIIPNKPVLHAIDTLRKQAISSKNKSSNFLFFISQSGMSFKTIEGMMNTTSIQTFKLDNTMGHDHTSDFYTNIISIEIEKNMDAINRITSGAVKQRVATFNPHTNEYVRADFTPTSNTFIMGGTSFITDAFKQLFGSSSKTTLFHVNPNQKLKVGKTNIPDNYVNKSQNLAAAKEQILRMTVLGDPILETGKTVKLNIPQVQASSSVVKLDIQNSGNWLISKLEHSIRGAETKPRYVCNLECIKGAQQS